MNNLSDAAKSLVNELMKTAVVFEHRPEDGDAFMVMDVIESVNHRVNTKELDLWTDELVDKFKDLHPDLVLTVRAGGIPPASLVAYKMRKIPYIFASKGHSLVLPLENCYVAGNRSYTEAKKIDLIVDKRCLPKGVRVLIIDDFLDQGNTALGMVDICEQAGATVVGMGFLIEKEEGRGRRFLMENGINIPIESVVVIERLEVGKMKVRGVEEWLDMD